MARGIADYRMTKEEGQVVVTCPCSFCSRVESERAGSQTLSGFGHCRDVAADGGCRQRVSGHAYVRDLNRQVGRLEQGFKLVLEAAGLGRAAREHYGNRAIKGGQMARAFQLFAQALDESLQHVVVVDMQGAGNLITRLAR